MCRLLNTIPENLKKKRFSKRIQQNVSVKTYPTKPIQQNVSNKTYPPKRIQQNVSTKKDYFESRLCDQT